MTMIKNKFIKLISLVLMIVISSCVSNNTTEEKIIEGYHLYNYSLKGNFVGVVDCGFENGSWKPMNDNLTLFETFPYNEGDKCGHIDFSVKCFGGMTYVNRYSCLKEFGFEVSHSLSYYNYSNLSDYCLVNVTIIK